MTTPKRFRWPVHNMDQVARHVARQFPELTRRQVMGVLQAFFATVRESSLAQWEAGESRPGVSLRSFGRFELVYRRARPNQFGGRTVPAKWTFVFRPKGVLMERIRAATSKTSADSPVETLPEDVGGTLDGSGVNGAVSEDVPHM